MLRLMKKVMSESTYDNKLRPGYYENNYANMAAAFVVETERWNLATELFPTEPSAVAPGQPSATGSHAGHGGNAGATVRTSTANLTLPPFVRGLAAAGEGSAAIDQNLEKLRNVGSNTAIREFEIKALSASMKNDHTKAIELMKNATMLEEQTSAPYGPPSLIKPTHELFGEILLRAGKPAEAAAQFKKALVRQPHRARSLLGAARAAAQSGDAAAATAAYTKFVEQWKQADEGLPELREARHYLDQIKTTKTTN